MQDLFSGETAVITGGTSGIGLSILRTLHAMGANVSTIARGQKSLSNLSKSLNSDRLLTVQGDCGSQSDVEEFISKTVGSFGSISIVIANAGVGSFGPFETIGFKSIQEMINTNLLGTIYTVQCAIPHMRRSTRKDVVIITSSAGYRGGANEAVYSATKHGQVGFGTALDRALRPEGFRVSLIAPGNTDTTFGHARGRDRVNSGDVQGLAPVDVANQVVHTLSQPAYVRIPLISILDSSQNL